jgi:hypothetical protein
MAIDFPDYRERVRAVSALAGQISANPEGATTAETDELVRQTMELEQHHRAYSRWLDGRIEAQKAKIARGAWWVLAFVLLFSTVVAYLVQAHQRHLRARVGHASVPCCIIRGPA